jgi:predicted nucleic acid-binding Zn ribbon protein
MARARTRPRAPSPLAAALWELVRRHVGDDTIRLMQVRELWPRIAGAGATALEAHSWPVGVSGELLTVHVHDSQWLHELTYLRQDLLRRLGELAPDTRLRSLRLRLGEVPPLATRRPPETPLPPPLPPPSFPPEPDAATREALDAVVDPELKQLIAGARIMLGRCRS